MSQSHDSRLFYGICIGEDLGELDPFSTNDDWIEFKGPKKPLDTHGERYDSAEWDSWRTQKYLFKQSDKFVEIEIYGYIDEPKYRVTGKEINVYGSRPYEINVEILQMNMESYDQSIKEFCEKYGIEYQQPKWYLVNYWG